MYFPYFRGRQNELLALREMVNNDALSEMIIPIIEPVTLSSTFLSTIELFIEKQRKIGIIYNPSVGSLCSKNLLNTNESERLTKILNSPCILNSVLVDGKNIVAKCNYDIAILKNKDNLDKYLSLEEKNNIKYVLIPDESTFRRKIKYKAILHQDQFTKAGKNSDYSKNDDEFYSDDIFYYKWENYLGFGDYSIVGDDFSTSGFAPYAIAIHIVYFSNSNKELRVHHFVSDSNNGIENPAKKYYEAVKKVAQWVDDNNIEKTSGLSFFINSYKKQTYHGLGIIKKYSIMHHLEIISNYFG
ncbi:MAG: sce7725 family protein [Pleomorphochaeta sp.]